MSTELLRKTVLPSYSAMLGTRNERESYFCAETSRSIEEMDSVCKSMDSSGAILDDEWTNPCKQDHARYNISLSDLALTIMEPMQRSSTVSG